MEIPFEDVYNEDNPVTYVEESLEEKEEMIENTHCVYRHFNNEFVAIVRELPGTTATACLSTTRPPRPATAATDQAATPSAAASSLRVGFFYEKKIFRGLDL